MASMKTRSRKTRSRPSRAASGFTFLPRSEYSRLHRYAGDGRYVVDAIEYSRWSIGRKLRLLRREAGLTRADVAFGAKLPLETISRIEHGHGDPAEGTVRRMVRAIRRAGHRSGPRARAS
jgi:DNA-binding XRE family transcriptional regulator